MKILLTATLAIGVLAGWVGAQDATTGPAAAGASAAAASPRIGAGSVIPVELTKSIDAKKAKTGDEVEAKVTQDLKAENGQLLIAKDTRVVGHVTQAQARMKEQKESRLGIGFDRAVTQAGEVSMPMSIQAIIAPPSLNSDSGSGSVPNSALPTPDPSTGMKGGPPSSAAGPQSTEPRTSADWPSANSSAARPPITGKTEGVVGFSDLKLAAANASQGSVVSSERNNVKLESGTMMLLRVNP